MKGMKDKRNSHGAVGKSSSEQHFRRSAAITFIGEISGALHLAQPGLTAGRQAGRQAGKQADEIQVNFEIFKVGYRPKYSTCRFVLPRYSIITALPMHSSRFFRVKSIGRLFYEVRKIRKPYNFLPIPTIKYYILNDSYYPICIH